MDKQKIKWLIFDYMYGHDMNSVDEEDQIQFEEYFEEWWENLKTKTEKTWYFEHKELKEVDHDQEYTCEDCAYDDGHLRPNVSCECGRNDDENTPLGEYDE